MLVVVFLVVFALASMTVVSVHILKSTGCSEWKIRLCCKKDCAWENIFTSCNQFS